MNMKELSAILSDNQNDISLFANGVLLMILKLLADSGKLVELDEISERINISHVSLNQHLNHLIKSGYVIKSNRVDKSKKPAYIKSYFEIEKNKYNNLIKILKKLTHALEQN